MRFDVVVLGDGPAALAAAAACSMAGLSVARVEPTVAHEPFAPAGIWVDELAGLDLDATTVLHTWDDVRVVTNQVHQPGRAYALLDGAQLATRLLEHAGGATVVRGRAVGANHDRWQSTVVLHDARLVDAVVVVDASGPWPALVHRSDEGDEPRPSAQVTTRTTVGVVARCSAPLGPAGACVLMDWSAPGDGRRRTIVVVVLRPRRRPVADPRDGADVGARPRPPLGSAARTGHPGRRRRRGRPGHRRAARAADPERAPTDRRLRCRRGHGRSDDRLVDRLAAARGARAGPGDRGRPRSPRDAGRGVGRRVGRGLAGRAPPGPSGGAVPPAVDARPRPRQGPGDDRRPAHPAARAVVPAAHRPGDGQRGGRRLPRAATQAAKRADPARSRAWFRLQLPWPRRARPA